MIIRFELKGLYYEDLAMPHHGSKRTTINFSNHLRETATCRNGLQPLDVTADFFPLFDNSSHHHHHRPAAAGRCRNRGLHFFMILIISLDGATRQFPFLRFPSFWRTFIKCSYVPITYLLATSAEFTGRVAPLWPRADIFLNSFCFLFIFCLLSP